MVYSSDKDEDVDMFIIRSALHNTPLLYFTPTNRETHRLDI
jgi:hypothetical protein